MSPLKIVVTGASGFIGSRVARALCGRFPDAAIIGVGRKNLSFPTDPLRNYFYVACDLLNGEFPEDLPDEVDVVIHLAGDRRTFVKTRDYSAQALSNITMTSRVADYATVSRAKMFVYASSVYVYSGETTAPFHENSLHIPAENLGATKLSSEALLRARAVAGDLKVLALRIGTVYGPGASEEQFIPQAIIKLRSDEPTAVFGSGDVKRDFVFIEDVVRAFVGTVNLRDREVDFEPLNVGTGTATSIRQVVQLLAQLVQCRKPVEFRIARNMKSKADTDHQLDLTRVRSVLGWQPEVSLQEGLRRTVESLSTESK